MFLGGTFVDCVRDLILMLLLLRRQLFVMTVV